MSHLYFFRSSLDSVQDFAALSQVQILRLVSIAPKKTLKSIKRTAEAYFANNVPHFVSPGQFENHFANLLPN